MADLESTTINHNATRVQDYLDDQIQIAADLTNIDELLARIQQQHEILEKQLAETRRQASEIQNTIVTKTTSLKEKALEYQAKQDDLDTRVKALTHSDVAEEATKRLESCLDKAHKINIARAYIELIQQVDSSTSKAIKALDTEPDTSVKEYRNQYALWEKMRDAQPAAEGAAPQLLFAVEQNNTQLYRKIRAVLEKSLRQILDQMKWPSKELNLSQDICRKWEYQVELLLDVQQPHLIATVPDATLSGVAPPTAPIILLPFEVMVQPLGTRFRYHFYGEKPTNRLDKPEYFLSHILDLVQQYSGFMTNMFGPILFRKSPRFKHTNNIYPDPVSAFITALLPLVTEKSLSFLPQVVADPHLLSHFMNEIMSFDRRIRDTWQYNPDPRTNGIWQGVTADLLSNHGYFQPWFTAEKDFALDRYKTVRAATDSLDLDFDSEPDQTKPTKFAVRIKNLIETITDRYRGLTTLNHKTRFLVDIQITILEDFHTYLHESLQAYIASSHTAGRIWGGLSETEVFGLRGLESIFKIYCSAEYLARKMSDWNDDVFLLELWDEICSRANDSERAASALENGPKMQDVAARLSTPAKADSGHDYEYDGSAVFDSLVTSYRRVRDKSEGEIFRAFDKNIRAALTSYAKQPQWSSLADSEIDRSSAPSPGLSGLFQTITVLLAYLTRAFASRPLTRLVRHICNTIQKEIFDHVVMGQTFSTSGALQLRTDISAIKELLQNTTQLPDPVGRRMERIEEATTLLSLPTVKKAGEDDDGAEDDWGFAEEDIQPPEGQSETRPSDLDSQARLGLWEVDKRLFKDNQEARNVLSELGLHHLSASEGRNILRRRVELNR